MTLKWISHEYSYYPWIVFRAAQHSVQSLRFASARPEGVRICHDPYARERYIDDFLKACLSEGLDQVVILASLVSHQKILSKQKLGVGLCLFAIVLTVI